MVSSWTCGSEYANLTVYIYPLHKSQHRPLIRPQCEGDIIEKKTYVSAHCESVACILPSILNVRTFRGDLSL